MSENLPNIDDLFRKALEEHEEAPSQDVWANLDKNLDKKKVVFISKKYRKLKWAAAALLIFSAGMAMYTWNTRLKNKELVKENEMNQKKVVKATTPRYENVATDTAQQNLAAQATDKVVRDTALVTKTETKEEKGISGTVKPTVEGSQAQNENNSAKMPGRATNKRTEDVVARIKTSSLTKEKIFANGTSQTVENDLNNKPSSSIVAAEKKSKVVQAAGEKNAGVQNEGVVEKTKRDVEIETVREREKKLSIAEAGNIEPVSTPVLIKETNKAGSADVASFKKASVKPFKGSRFSATVFYSQDFTSTRVDNDRHAFREDDRNEIKDKEKISNSSSKGVLVNYSIGNNWSVQSGLVFSTMTTDIQPKTIFARPDNRGIINYRFNCSAGYSFVTLKTGAGPAAGDSVRALSSKNTLGYVAIPIGVNYTLYAGKFTLQPGAGLAFNFLTKGKIETEIEGQGEKATLNRIEGLNSSFLNGSLSLSANYYFTKNLALNFTPSTRFALSGINKDAPVKTYLNSFGLAAGLTIGF